MKIERVKVSDLLPDPSNARLHSNKNLDAIKASLKKFSQVEALVVQRGTNVVIGGNGRLMAMKELGIEDTEVHYLDVDNTTAKALAIALNRTAETATWDMDVLGDTLQGLQEDDWNLGDLGFELDDLPEFMPDDESSGNAGLTDPDEIPEVTEPIAKRGQIWKLGEHRVMCGDSTSKDDVDRLMDGEKADITFTSPPYNVGKTPNGNEQKYLHDSDNKETSEYLHFLNEFTSNCLDHSEYVFSNIQSLAVNKIALIEHMYSMRHVFSDTIIWDKQTAEPAMAHKVLNSQFEYIHVFSKEAKRVIGTKDFRGTISNIFSLNSRQGKDFAKVHKATFPVLLSEYFVSNFSNNSCMDPFLGTGTTLIACEKTGRRCFGMEISESYTDVIISRWEQFTGNKAELING